MASELQEKVAWIHQAATDLSTSDLVELKLTLRSLAKEAEETAELARRELRRRRVKASMEHESVRRKGARV